MIEWTGELRDRIEEATGVTPAVKNDGIISDKGNYEILIGKCDRAQIADVYKELEKVPNHACDYILRMVGKKLVIGADSTYALESAIGYLNTNYIAKKRSVPKNLNYVHRSGLKSMTLAGVDIGKYVIQLDMYPALNLARAAEEMQAAITEKTGYELPIVKVDKKKTNRPYRIEVGPQVGKQMTTVSGKAFTVDETSANMKIQPEGVLTNVDLGTYKIGMSGKNLVINGGSVYAVDAGVKAWIKQLNSGKTFAAGYALTGEYHAKSYTLAGDYALTWAEEFNYTGSHSAVENAVRNHWTVSSDNNSVTMCGTSYPQLRPGKYGVNWWISNDSTNNGYLLEITRWNGSGFDAGRLTTQKKSEFLYGIIDTRIVCATHNGACSAVWANAKKLDGNGNAEFDIYENFGKDILCPDLHTWKSDAVKSKTDPGHINHATAGDMAEMAISAEQIYGKGEHYYDTFHHITMEWSKYLVAFYVDDYLITQVRTTGTTPKSGISWNAMRTPIHDFRLANGVGDTSYCNHFGGNSTVVDLMKDYTKFFEIQTVDYVRLYQKDDGASYYKAL